MKMKRRFYTNSYCCNVHDINFVLWQVIQLCICLFVRGLLNKEAAEQICRESDNEVFHCMLSVMPQFHLPNFVENSRDNGKNDQQGTRSNLTCALDFKTITFNFQRELQRSCLQHLKMCNDHSIVLIMAGGRSLKLM